MTAKDIQEFQDRKSKLKTIGEFKELGRELRDKFKLTDMEAINLLNGKHEMEILAKYEG